MAFQDPQDPFGPPTKPKGTLMPGYHWVWSEENGQYMMEPDAPAPGLGEVPGQPGLPKTPKPADRPGGHWEELFNPPGWRFVADPPPTGKTDTTPPPTTTGGGGGGFDFSGGIGSFHGSLSPRATFAPVPEFNAPKMPVYPDFAFTEPKPAAFVAPTREDVLAEPGYQFRFGQGQQALEQSAAGRGSLRTGGTLKDLIQYGQNFASNEYSNIYGRRAGEHDRAFSEYLKDYDLASKTYSTNYGVSRDKYDRDFTAAQAEFQPRLVGWQTGANADQRAAELLFGREWDQYAFERNLEQQRLLAIFNKDNG